MGGSVQKSFEAPEEKRDFDNGQVQIVSLPTQKVGRAEFQPGWKWSTSVKPIVGGDSCQAHHVGYVVSGTLHVKTDDGDELDLKTGDVYDIQPGHDAWVTGNENWVSLEFEHTTADTYGKK
jgi:mannose-6-phosphate isomerase-like protein (cupin superfamily)